VENQTNWATNNIFHTYVKLKSGVIQKLLKKKLQPFIDRRAGADMKAWAFHINYFIQPVRDIYLHSDLDGESLPMEILLISILWVHSLVCIALSPASIL